MKKKMVSILTAAFCASALLAGCGSADTAKTSASSAGAASSSADGTTTFTVGFDAEYPPYGYMDDETGDYTGFDLELAEAVCEIYGWKLVKTPINWDAKDTELNSGAIDCIWNGFTMNGREDDYTWSDPYVDNSQVMVVSENSGINSLSDLAGKTVGVQAASAALDLLQSEEELADTFAALQQFPDYNNAFVELQAGSIDAVAMDIGVAKYQLESRGEGYKILDEHLNSEKYAIGFKKGNTELCDKVNEGLQLVLADGIDIDICPDARIFPAARSADRLRAYVEKPDCERNFPALYLPDARHASDAAAHGGLLRTVLSVRYEHRKMALSGDYHRICLKLRRLFCRNLPLRHRFDGSWTVRGSKASWLFEGTDVCPHYSAAGCETDSAGDHQ